LLFYISKLLFELLGKFIRYISEPMRIKNFTNFKGLLESQNEIDSNIMDSCCSGTWEVRDGLIFVDGDFLASGGLGDRESLGNLKFGEVTGNFDISDNNLKTLDGCPSLVDGGFNCSSNRLENLKGGPKSVKKSYSCSNNFISDISDIALDSESYGLSGNIIENLVKFPEKISGSFLINNNELLKELEGCPREIGGNFDVSDCPLLNSLKGGPETVGKNYLCSNSGLDNLNGAPKKVGGFLDLSGNNLINLKGIPGKVGRWIAANNNKIETLEGLKGSATDSSFMFSRNTSPEPLLKLQHNYLRQNPENEIEGYNWVTYLLKMSPKSLLRALSGRKSFYIERDKQMQSGEARRNILEMLGLEKISHDNPKILAPLIIELKKSKDYEGIIEYIEDNMDSFSDEFKDDYGVSKDLSDLGF